MSDWLKLQSQASHNPLHPSIYWISTVIRLVVMLSLLAASLSFIITSFLARRLLKIFFSRKTKKYGVSYRIAFLHPFANAGGGGERMLWMAIEATQHAFPNAEICLLCDMEGKTGDQIKNQARKNFGLKLEGPIRFCSLLSAGFCKPSRYPILTLAMQALGTTLMGIECLLWSLPVPINLIIDTMGCAFAYPPLALLGTPIIPYVHYPFIHFDPSSSLDQNAKLLKRLRRWYYSCIARWYATCGTLTTLAMVNSRWTLARMQKTWDKSRLMVVYPPCDLSQLASLSLNEEDREPIIISLAQFRREKGHSKQLEVLCKLFERRPEWQGKVKLQIVGSCRPGNNDDRTLLKQLQELAKDLGLEGDVIFSVNVSHEEITQDLGNASLGIHTMEEEHFGIGIVEMMASGLIVVAHQSGGPASDIISVEDGDGAKATGNGALGYLASTVDEYAEIVEKALAMPTSAKQDIRQRARSWATSQFGGNKFENQFISVISDCLTPLGKQKAD